MSTKSTTSTMSNISPVRPIRQITHDPLDPISPNEPTAAPTPAADTEVLVDAPSTLPVPSGGTAPAIIPEGWAGVAYWSRLAGRLEHARLAAQVMCGFSLLELHKQFRVRPGRPSKKLPQNSEINPVDPEFPKNSGINPNATWPELVRGFAGISEDTAGNYMAMAEACRPRLKKLQSGPRLRELLLLPPSSWTDDDMTLVSAAVRKLSDGRTQLDFMQELGLIKTGPNPTGGARPAAQPKNQFEALEQAALQVREEWMHAERHLLLVVGPRFTVLNDTQVEAQCACLEICLKARRKWLATPTTERNTGPIEELFT